MMTGKRLTRAIKLRHSSRGIALIWVLWALFLLAAVVVILARQVTRQTSIQRQDFHALRARAFAYSGVQIGLHPNITDNSFTALHSHPTSSHGFDVELSGEAGKLNLNWLVRDHDPIKLGILQRYLCSRGAELDDVNTFIDCLQDWTSPGNTHRLNGSKTDIHGNPVPGRPLQTLDELRQMQHGTALTQIPKWERDFTVLTPGGVDLQWASEFVIAALPGIDIDRARIFVQARRGPDGVDGTRDDLALDNPTTVSQLLRLSATDYAQLAAYVVTRDPTMNIVSTGKDGNVVRRLEVTATKQPAVSARILRWEEK